MRSLRFDCLWCKSERTPPNSSNTIDNNVHWAGSWGSVKLYGWALSYFGEQDIISLNIRAAWRRCLSQMKWNLSWILYFDFVCRKSNRKTYLRYLENKNKTIVEYAYQTIDQGSRWCSNRPVLPFKNESPVPLNCLSVERAELRWIDQRRHLLSLPLPVCQDIRWTVTDRDGSTIQLTPTW